MTTEEWFENAVYYFNGTMTIEQSQHFEEITAASEELSKLMHLWKNLNEEAPVYEQYREHAEKLVQTHNRLKADFINDAPDISDGKVRSGIWKWVGVAATIAGIIIVMKIFTPSSHNDSPLAEHKLNGDTLEKIIAKDSAIRNSQAQKLYAQYFVPDNVPENPNGLLDDAFFYYASAQYRKAITAIDKSANKALTRGSGSATSLNTFYASYYKALSLLSLNNATDAIPLLNTSVNLAPSASYKSKAQWYLALAYLKDENIASAKETLHLLINSHSTGYQTKAAGLFEGLNK